MEKKLVQNQQFQGERPLYALHGIVLKNVKILDGESAIKECSDVEAYDCEFQGKYPFWIIDGVTIKNCLFAEGARAALWYLRNLSMSDSVINAPKTLRELQGVKLHNVNITDAKETLWQCCNVELDGVTCQGADYLLFHSFNVNISNYKHTGAYSFQYCRNITIRNADIQSKDAFWNSENIIVYDSKVSGEYLAWHSRNIKFVRCHISGSQPLCYVDNLVLEDCTFGDNADLAFEYSTVRASIKGNITSVKNPTSGFVCADSIGEVIIDQNIKQPANCEITVSSRQ